MKNNIFKIIILFLFFGICLLFKTKERMNNFKNNIFKNTNNKEYWKYIKNIKPNAKLCFIHTPKCGGQYAKQILDDLKIKNKGHHRPKNNNNNYITFTIIRNPVERFESLLNYRLTEFELKGKIRKDWPKNLKYVYYDKSITLNEIVNKMNNNNILGFFPYKSLTYWSKNIDIFITIDNLHNFLSYFGYNYNVNKYLKKNVSKKERGVFNKLIKNRIAYLYSKDIILFENNIK